MSHIYERCDLPAKWLRHPGALWACDCGQLWVVRVGQLGKVWEPLRREVAP